MCKALKLGLLAFAVLGMAFLGCDKPAAPTDQTPDTPGPVKTAVDYPFVTDILAGQTNDVGDITIYYTSDYIYVKYTTTGAWYLTQYHVAVVTDCQNGWEPFLKNGNPAPGQFPWKDELDTPTQEILVEIPWESDYGDFWGELELCFAAHCVVESIVGNTTYDEQTGWGEGEPFPGSNWAMFFCVPVVKCLRIPTERVTTHFHGSYPGTNTPYPFTLSSVQPGYDIWNSPPDYPSFCLDQYVYISAGVPYSARLWSSYDPSLPNYLKYVPGTTNIMPWPKLNWLLNYMIELRGLPIPQTYFLQLQHVFWHWRGCYPTLSAAELALEQLADAHPSFYPMPGQYMAILQDINPGATQLTFLIVDP